MYGIDSFKIYTLFVKVGALHYLFTSTTIYIYICLNQVILRMFYELTP